MVQTLPTIPRLNGFTLKLIALMSMLTDHIGAVLFPQVELLRYIGRAAFPIYAFLLVEGFFHTKSTAKYEFRLILFALLSEIPFDLAFSGEIIDATAQNVSFTLAIGFVMMDLINRFEKKIAAEAIILIACVLAAFFLRTDYGVGGILIIYFFFRFRDNFAVKAVTTLIVCALCFDLVELFCLFAFVPIFFYNGKRGPEVKYPFYIFYPAHLLILAVIALTGLTVAYSSGGLSCITV